MSKSTSRQGSLLIDGTRIDPEVFHDQIEPLFERIMSRLVKMSVCALTGDTATDVLMQVSPYGRAYMQPVQAEGCVTLFPVGASVGAFIDTQRRMAFAYIEREDSAPVNDTKAFASESHSYVVTIPLPFGGEESGTIRGFENALSAVCGHHRMMIEGLRNSVQNSDGFTADMVSELDRICDEMRSDVAASGGDITLAAARDNADSSGMESVMEMLRKATGGTKH